MTWLLEGRDTQEQGGERREGDRHSHPGLAERVSKDSEREGGGREG